MVEARLASVRHAEARVGLDLPVGSWPSRRVELCEDDEGQRWLLFQAAPRTATEVRPSSNMLLKFVGLADAADEEIAAFAEANGELDLCIKHGLPLTNGAGVTVEQVYDYTTWQQQTDSGEQVPYHRHPASHEIDATRQCLPYVLSSGNAESVESWRAYSRRVAALVRLAAQVNEGKAGDPNHWRDLGVDPETLIHPPLDTIGNFLNYWMRLANLRLGITLERSDEVQGRWTLAPRLNTSSLFAGLVSEVIRAVAAPGRYTYCAECGALFAPLPKANRGRSRRAFCPDCGVTAAQKHAARDYRARQLGATQLAPATKEGVHG